MERGAERSGRRGVCCRATPAGRARRPHGKRAAAERGRGGDGLWVSSEPAARALTRADQEALAARGLLHLDARAARVVKGRQLDLLAGLQDDVGVGAGRAVELLHLRRGKVRDEQVKREWHAEGGMMGTGRPTRRGSERRATSQAWRSPRQSMPQDGCRGGAQRAGHPPRRGRPRTRRRCQPGSRRWWRCRCGTPARFRARGSRAPSPAA